MLKPKSCQSSGCTHIRQTGRKSLNKRLWFDHPPYIPDYIPSDYHLFNYLKKWVGSQRFNNNEELMGGVRMWLSQQAVDFFGTGVQKLIPRCDRCLNSGSDHVEKALEYVRIFCI
jgi:hypothetical protein